MFGVAEWGNFGSFLSGVVATLTLLGGIAYWAVRRAVDVATKDYVEEQLEAKVGPIERTLDDAAVLAQENREDLQALQDLLEGGNSQFEMGMMDFLEKNIERTEAVQADLDEIKLALLELQARVEGNPDPDRDPSPEPDPSVDDRDDQFP